MPKRTRTTTAGRATVRRRAHRGPYVHPAHGAVNRRNLKRLHGSAGFAAITTTAQIQNFNNIAAGTELYERTEREVVNYSFKYKGNLKWGANNESIRIIFHTATPAYDGTGVTMIANIYSKQAFPDIGHVFKDFRITHKNDTQLVTPFNVTIPLKGWGVTYTGDAAGTQLTRRYSCLMMTIVGDSATGTDTVTNTRYTLRYRG